ncbi:5-formyltetrahydrofolate cyclo-ligase [Pelagibacterales bacterium SAG-MED43]|nr:5-formyltetrahydrofolate cyclo-ligase [Pelagibacterales bacterium SAG-MED43]
MNKLSIRKKILKLRKKKYSKNLSISPSKLLKFLERKRLKSKIIGGYYPFNYELDILNILEIFEKKNYFISLPKIAKSNQMDFFQWSFKDPLRINKFGIPETTSNKKVYPNILLIPLVGFDNQLNRLGYGGGFYDRYLSKVQDKHKIIRIGVGFSFQKIKNIPINKHDKKLDCIITERKIIE